MGALSDFVVSSGAEGIAQGAKSGQWVALNKKNGATFNPTGANALSTAAPSSASLSNVPAASIESVLPSAHAHGQPGSNEN